MAAPEPRPLTAALLAPGELRGSGDAECSSPRRGVAAGSDAGSEPGGVPRCGLTPAPKPLSVCPVRLHGTGGHSCGSGTEVSALPPKRPGPVPGA